MPTLTHVHTFVKYNKNQYKRKDLFKCDDPHCTCFYEKAMLMGKASLCTICGNEIILDNENMRRSRPRCKLCSNTAEGRRARAIKGVIGDMLEKIEYSEGPEHE